MGDLRETNEDMVAEVELLKKQLETARKNLERERELHAEVFSMDEVMSLKDTLFAAQLLSWRFRTTIDQQHATYKRSSTAAPRQQ